MPATEFSAQNKKDLQMIRVISGTAGGLKLHTLDSENTKPTLDRVKEAVFSIISRDIYGSTVLDLFSGSGALGIEALSRGAKKCFFNDKSKSCCGIINMNLEHTKLSGRSEVSCADYTDALMLYGRQAIKFDIILLDPPYKKGFYIETFHLIEKNNLAAEHCTIVCEHSYTDTLPDTIGRFYKQKEKKYGTVSVSVYGNEEL